MLAEATFDPATLERWNEKWAFGSSPFSVCAAQCRVRDLAIPPGCPRFWHLGCIVRKCRVRGRPPPPSINNDYPALSNTSPAVPGKLADRVYAAALWGLRHHSDLPKGPFRGARTHLSVRTGCPHEVFDSDDSQARFAVCTRMSIVVWVVADVPPLTPPQHQIDRRRKSAKGTAALPVHSRRGTAKLVVDLVHIQSK